MTVKMVKIMSHIKLHASRDPRSQILKAFRLFDDYIARELGETIADEDL